MRGLLLGLACLLAGASCRPWSGPPDEDDDLGPVGSFSLTERGGRTVTQADLLGRTWIASFVFTRCTGGCPQVSATLSRLQQDLASQPVTLVTFTVDPGHDDPDELRKYAARYQADPERWLFLTGPEDEIYRLLRHDFHVHVAQRQGKERTEGNEVDHSTKLVLVDRRGRIRGYFDGLPGPGGSEAEELFEANLRRLKNESVRVAHEEWYLPRDFPRLNATLNAIATLLLVAGYAAIRRRLERLHTACMLAALAVSTLFLASYLYYHLAVKRGMVTHFEDQAPGAPPWVGRVYLAVLVSHSVLAPTAAPLALLTAWLGLRGRLRRHVRLARWVLPVWLYVSVTGVAVYWMLYQLYPAP